MTTHSIPKVTILLAEGKHQEAYSLIRDAYSKHPKRKDVAKALGARSLTSIQKWIAKIKAAGLKDPRIGLEVAAAGKKIEKFTAKRARGARA